jgi:hypothetical protein
MRLVDDDPMRAAGLRTQFMEARKQSGKKRRPFLYADADQIYDRVFLRLRHHIQHFGDTRRPFIVAQYNGPGKLGVIAFRIDD